MKNKLHKLMGVALVAMLLASLTVGLAVPAAADPGTLEWSKMSFPKAGSDGDWFRDVNIKYLGPIVKAIDDKTLYVGGFYDADNDGTWDAGETSLFKSTTDGRTWSRLTKLPSTSAPIMDIHCSSNNADVVYVTDGYDIFKTSDAGASWDTLANLFTSSLSWPTPPTGIIDTLAVGYIGGSPYIFAGTAFGVGADGVYVCLEAVYGMPWSDVGIDTSRAVPWGFNTTDVYDIMLSPKFATDQMVIAIASGDPTGALPYGTYATTKYAGAQWASTLPDVELLYSNTTSITAPYHADIWLPGDFSSSTGSGLMEYFVGIASTAANQGDVYRLITNHSFDQDIGGSGTYRAVTEIDGAGSVGSAYIMAGGYDVTAPTVPLVYHTEDNGDTWAKSKDNPTGGTFFIGAETSVVVAADYASTGKAWTATGGNDCAVSLTLDYGVLFNQISLIQTNIGTVNDLGFAGANRFMATTPGFSLPDATDAFTITDATGGDSGTLVITSGTVAVTGTGTYAAGAWSTTAGQTIIVTATAISAAGYWTQTTGTATAAITTDTDNDASLAPSAKNSLWRYDGTFWERVALATAIDLVQGSPDGSAVFYAAKTTFKIYRSTDGGNRFIGLLTAAPYLGSWVVIDKSTIIVSGTGVTSKTTTNGTTWGSNKTCGTVAINSFALSPAFATDKTIIAGNASGAVYKSTDTGDAWKVVGTTVLTAGPAYVAFDPLYTTNSTLYAAGGAIVERYNGTKWEAILTAAGTVFTPAFATASGLVSSADGTLYATDATGFKGIARSLTPTASSETTCEWENVTKGDVVQLSNLRLTYGTGSNILWGISGANVWAYDDTLAIPIVLTSPVDKTSSGRVTAVSFLWTEPTTLAKKYQVQVATDAKCKVTILDTVASVPGLYYYSIDPAFQGMTLYWRVRVAFGQPTYSRWSTAWSFSTQLTQAQWNPFSGPVSETPYPGQTDVPLRPAFAWNAADWATAYEFEVSKAPGTTAGGFFIDALIGMTGTNALVNTVWQCNIDLDYSATYYWHVKAISATSKSEWATGVFTTMAKPVPPPTPPTPLPPVELPAPISPAWIWAVVIIGAILVIAVIVLIVTTRRVP